MATLSLLEMRSNSAILPKVVVSCFLGHPKCPLGYPGVGLFSVALALDVSMVHGEQVLGDRISHFHRPQ